MRPEVQARRELALQAVYRVADVDGGGYRVGSDASVLDGRGTELVADDDCAGAVGPREVGDGDVAVLDAGAAALLQPDAAHVRLGLGTLRVVHPDGDAPDERAPMAAADPDLVDAVVGVVAAEDPERPGVVRGVQSLGPVLDVAVSDGQLPDALGEDVDGVTPGRAVGEFDVLEQELGARVGRGDLEAGLRDPAVAPERHVPDDVGTPVHRDVVDGRDAGLPTVEGEPLEREVPELAEHQPVAPLAFGRDER
ncbi:hypothetical protein BRD15_07960, partial [Halobacteriales archaeon SW_6_65_15]